MFFSNSAQMLAICKKAALIGPISPLRQSTVIEPNTISRSRFCRTNSIISQNWRTDLDRRETSHTMSVEPLSIWSNRKSRLGFTLASPCSRSVMISSAPAAWSSLVCRRRSCPRRSPRAGEGGCARDHLRGAGALRRGRQQERQVTFAKPVN